MSRKKNNIIKSYKTILLLPHNQELLKSVYEYIETRWPDKQQNKYIE